MQGRQVFGRYRQAMMHLDANALAELYAADGVHEFPLFSPFLPQVLRGREEIRRAYKAAWGAAQLRLLEVREVAVHETADSAVVIAEGRSTAEAIGSGKRFELSFIVVMRLRDGEIVHLRDYMDSLGAAVGLDRLPALASALAAKP